MPYESALPNQNKGYAKQEKKDLMNDMPIDKRASGGSYLSKHMSGSPLHSFEGGLHASKVKHAKDGSKKHLGKK